MFGRKIWSVWFVGSDGSVGLVVDNLTRKEACDFSERMGRFLDRYPRIRSELDVVEIVANKGER